MQSTLPTESGFDSYLDPRSREPFTSNTTFKSALFTPTTVIDLKTLTSAVKTYEELTGIR